ncbi:MAG: hypothetical protein GY788_02035 [bacterium]|nr:hypothetical protein [bacterium]
MAIEYLDGGNDDGTSFGQSITEKISFYGVTAVVQPSGAGQAAVTTSVTTTATAANLATTMVDVLVAVNKVRTDLVALGLWKGSA